MRRPCRTSTKPRSASARITSRAVVFETPLFVIGPDSRTLVLGKEDVGYVPIVPIDVDVVLCPTFSLMGIDRGGGPTLEEALMEIGIGAGARIAIVGWKALRAGEWNG